MTKINFKTRLKALRFTKKIILLGAGITVLSVFLPWYQDKDRFNTGDLFLGITGPLYLAGIIVLLASAVSVGIIMLEVMQKPLPKLPLKEDHFHVLNSAISLALLVLSSSVYFHAKFGLNLTEKTMGVGMIAAFFGSLLVLAGGIMNIKRKEISFDEEGEFKPLINMSEEERIANSIRPHRADVGEQVTQIHQKSLEEFENNNFR